MKTAVGLFVDRYPVLSETFVVNEARALVRLGHEVSVEARRHPGSEPPAGSEDFAVHYSGEESRGQRLRALCWLIGRHPLRAGSDAVGRLARSSEARGIPLRRLAVRARRLDALGPDVHVHTHFATGISDEAYRVGRLIGAPTSLTAHAYDIYIAPGRLRERLIRSHFVTSGCDYTVADLRAVMGSHAHTAVHKQVMGVEHGAFQRSTPLPGGRHVAAVGRLVEKKGFIHLVRAAARLPGVTFSIAGEGPERAALEEEIAALGLSDRVSLVGAASPSEVRALLERSDLLCMPCVVAANGDRDSMPVVVKEAMAMELCVVASDEVGLPEIVQPPWGVLVPPRDDEALAEAMERTLSLGPGERAEAGKAARRHVISHADVHVETGRLSAWIEDAQAAR